jgi:hypothetical protein
MLFYVSLKMSTEIERTKVEASHGLFTDSRCYPVLDTIYNPAMGMQLLVPDDAGMMKYYQMDMFKFANLDGSPIEPPTEIEKKPRIPGAKKEKEIADSRQPD